MNQPIKNVNSINLFINASKFTHKMLNVLTLFVALFFLVAHIQHLYESSSEINLEAPECNESGQVSSDSQVRNDDGIPVRPPGSN